MSNLQLLALMAFILVLVGVTIPLAVQELREERKTRHRRVLQAQIDAILDRPRPVRVASFPVRVTKIADRRRRTSAIAPLIADVPLPIEALPEPDPIVVD